ncbi:hypothetical protein FOMPIDRAFT_1116805 [Fomitopsis schrenkii]|uniref:Aquaporin-like protein n=1 Tax=Fomitopsis schrenkii TaxID=2126942 RepID=S8FPB4_FOMSC|nr:hypothetical protein FOMPIDRAFT_1116805 [Fomitopsis schrenkii]
MLANWLDDVKAALLEFVGTTTFLLLAFGGVQAASSEMDSTSGAGTNNVIHVMYIALAMGFSLLISVWIFYRASGGVFNPNVSLALFLTGVVGPLRFVLYCIAQLIGGIVAAALVLALTPGRLQSVTSLSPGINPAQAVFIEMFITTALVLAVLMMAAEKHSATPFAPVGIGLTLFACHLWAVSYTGAGMNVARAFGPAVVSGFPYGSQWVYWVGDGLGSLLGAALYIILKQNRYWRLTPGQDTTDHTQSPNVPLQDGISLGRRRSASRSRRTGSLGRRTAPEDSFLCEKASTAHSDGNTGAANGSETSPGKTRVNVSPV